MAYHRHNKNPAATIFTYAVAWAILSSIFPLYEFWGLLMTVGLAFLTVFLAGKARGKREAEAEKKKQSAGKTASSSAKPRKTSSVTKTDAAPEVKKPAAAKKSYGPEIDPIIEEGNRALSEMGRLYMSIPDPEVKKKINELMRVTDKIVQDAIADPTDIPQIKKFLNYYLPTTIKLLNTYDRMSAQGIQGENLDKSMKSINEMLDTAIEAFKRHLDSLFDNQALDIETEISVMNTMLAREGLTGQKDFVIKDKPKEEPKGQVMVQESK